VPARPGLLLTGASGVVGRALMPQLGGFDVVSLCHRADPGGTVVRADLTRPRLGLDATTYRDLAARTTTVVHAAAITDFGVGEPATSALNVDGTARVLDLAAEAGARVLYVSTAFVARTDLTTEARGTDAWEAAISPAAYLGSKRRAEALVRDSGLPVTIARPSVVLGHSRTGEIARFQGLHAVFRAVLRNEVPIMPLPATSLVDVVPVDVVAGALAALLAAGLPGGEHWLTAGPAAPTVADLAAECVRQAHAAGRPADGPRYVTLDMVERLFRPVFVDPLPERLRRRFDDLVAMCALFTDAPEFPTSLGRLPGGPPRLTRADVDTAVRASVAHLAGRLGLERRAA
jgi:nucleoside-diphosphate-sugar epimerase